MANRIGLWVDHKQAVIVSVDERGASVKKIESGARHVEYRGAPHPKTPYSAQHARGDDRLDQQFLHHLNKYYEQLVALLGGAGSILILGPGEAKIELSKRLARDKGRRRAILIEPADKMTDRQIVARVRTHFQGNGAGA